MPFAPDGFCLGNCGTCHFRREGAKPTDGLMMPEKQLVYRLYVQNDQWKDYWEGDLKRKRNIVVTTQSLMCFANYGVMDQAEQYPLHFLM